MDNTANFRSRTIAVSHQTHWMLSRLAAAMREATGPLDKPETADSIADTILGQHLKEQYPQLVVHWNYKKKNDESAVESLRSTPATKE